MAYVNGTTHYNLPQTVGTDKRDWADTNQAFADIDAALYGAVDDVAQAETAISELQTRMSTAEENITDNTADIAGLDTRLTTAEGAITSQQSQITDLRQDTEDMICAYNEASATSTHMYAIGDYFIYNDVLYKATQAIAIGDTIVPDTNCATTNVSSELLNIRNDIPTTDEYMIVAPFCDFKEDSMTATRAYTIGDTVLIDHTAYIVITPVNSGDVFTVDSNVKIFKFGSTVPTKLATHVLGSSDNLKTALTWAMSYIENITTDRLYKIKIHVNQLIFSITGYDGSYIYLSTSYMSTNNTMYKIAATYQLSSHTFQHDGVYGFAEDPSGTYGYGFMSAVSVVDGASIDVYI